MRYIDYMHEFISLVIIGGIITLAMFAFGIVSGVVIMIFSFILTPFILLYNKLRGKSWKIQYA